MSASHSTASSAATSTQIATALTALYIIWGSTYLAIRFALQGGFPPFLIDPIDFAGVYAARKAQAEGQPVGNA